MEKTTLLRQGLLQHPLNPPSTTPWLCRSLLFLILWHGLVLRCLVDLCLIPSGQQELGRQAGGHVFAWRAGFQSQDLRFPLQYIVLRAPGYNCPLRVQRAGDYRHIVQDFTGPTIWKGSDLEVLVVDLKEDALVGLEPFNAQVHTSDLVTGYVEDLAVVPEFSSVLAFTRQWVNVMDAQRISFYSADEGGTTPTAKLKAKAKTKGGVVPKPPKPMSAKKVAEAIGSMAEMMPMLQAQLVTMQEEQKRMQEALNLQSVQAAMRPGQTPVSSSLQDFMALTGPPPKTKGVTLKPPPQRVPKAVSKDTDLSLAQQSEQAWHWQC